jgi:hypothetical protein
MGASSGSATVTAPVGAGLTATAIILSNIRRIEFDILKEMLYVTQSDGRVVEFAYDTIATVTYTIAGQVATITVST